MAELRSWSVENVYPRSVDQHSKHTTFVKSLGDQRMHQGYIHGTHEPELDYFARRLLQAVGGKNFTLKDTNCSTLTSDFSNWR